MRMLLQDLRYAWRQLMTAPAFTVIAVLTLALGIGGTTAVLSVANALFFRALPVPDAGRVVTATEYREDGSPAQVVQHPDYLVYREATGGVFTELAAVGSRTFGMRTGEGAETVPGAFVSGNYFRMLRVQPALGRFLEEADDVAGAAAVAVLSHDLWQSRFAGDPAVLGRTVHLNAQPLTVVGVASEGFHGSLITSTPQLWVPIAAREVVAPELREVEGGRWHWLWMQGRLTDGVDRRQAEAALTVVVRQLSDEREEPSRAASVGLTAAGSVPAGMRGEARTLSGIMLVASALVLLLASVNVAGMLLARATGRRREMAIRRAIGAGSGRLVRQLVTESALLFLVGGAFGLVLAYGLVGVVAGLLTTPGGPLPLANLDPSMEGGVLALALIVSLVIGLLCGLAPALQAARGELGGSMKEASAGSGRSRSRLRSALVVGQVALCLLLLMATGVLIRSLQEAARVDLGFEYAGVLTARLNLGARGYDAESGAALYRRLGERLRSLPMVQGVSFSDVYPLGGMEVTTSLSVAGAEPVELMYNPVSHGYFGTLGIPLRRGRGFDEGDRAGAPPVAVVNESFAHRYFPGESPLGRPIRISDQEVEIVGVVGDTRWSSLEEEAFPFAYRPLEQDHASAVSLILRTSGDPMALATLVRRELQAIDPDLALQNVTTLAETVARLTLPQRIAARGAGVFGGVGLLLTLVGLYGLLAYTVSQRTREIGVRMALGAAAGNVVGMVLRQGALLVAVGAAAGLALSVWLLPLLGGLLFGVVPSDPAALLTVLLLLAGVTMAAAYLPARRAARVDPMVALRAE